MATLDPSRYEVVLITPLPIETRAALLMFDERHHGRFPVDRGDDYVYHAGAMAGHNVAIATLPAGQEYGTGAAAALANHIKTFFPALRFGLLVGVAAGLPDLSREPARDIRLGDVLVALPEGDTAAVIAYELGKETEDGFQLLRHGHVLATTAPIVRSAIGMIQIEAPDDADKFLPYYEKIRDKQHANGSFSDPGQKNDVLFIAKDGVEKIAKREPRPDSRRVRAWYGPIGAGDKLWKNARGRDELREKYGLIGLEMEAAGTMNQIPVGVIRGVCDYGDGHKNKIWQPYAAAMAAAYARALLDEIPRKDSVSIPKQPQQLQIEQSRHMEQTDGREPRATSVLIPFARDKDFVKRGDTFELIERNCRPGSRTALVGFGGVGKSQLAIEYGYRIHEKSPETSVFWIHASKSARFEQSFQDIAAHVDIPGRHDAKSNQLELVYDWLRHRKNGPWLLILDNLDDPSFLKSCGPGLEAAANASARQLGSYIPHCQHGSVLVTSRMRTAALQLVEDADIIAVEPMQEEEATQLFRNKLGQRDEAYTAELAAALDYMPLAIVQAAAYVLQRRPRYSLQRYLREFRNSDIKKVDLLSLEAGHLRRDTEAKNAILTTWQISFDYIKMIRPSAADLLSLMCFCDREGIPEYLLRSHIDPHEAHLNVSGTVDVTDGKRSIGNSDGGSYLDRTAELDDDAMDIDGIESHGGSDDSISEREFDFNDQDSFENDIFTLRSFSFITANEDGTTFGMHKLVQLATIEWLKAQDTYGQRRQRFLEKLANAMPLATHNNLSICKNLFPYAKRVASECPTFWGRGQWEEAERLYLDVIDMQTQTPHLGADHPKTLCTKTALASLYWERDQWERAEELWLEVVNTQTARLGIDHSDTLCTRLLLASTLSQRRQWERAEELYLDLINTQTAKLGADHPDTLLAKTALAADYVNQKRWTDAEQILVLVLQAHVARVGVDHGDSQLCIKFLSVVYILHAIETCWASIGGRS